MRTTAFSFLLCIAALAAEPLKLTDAIRSDIQLMRERVSLPGGSGPVYASARAIAAAHRVFAAVPLVAMSQQEVVALLGEPSETVLPSASSAAGRLVYRFDYGEGGWEYVLTLDTHSRVTKLRKQSYE